MSIVIVKRSQRVAGPALPTGEVELAEPPVLGEPASLDFGSAMVYLPMGLGSAAMVMMFSIAGSSPTVYMMSGMMGVSMVSMSVTQLGRQGMERKRKMRAERRDYLRYLAQLRGQARAAADDQRAASRWDNPEPSSLWSLVSGPRLWERRASHEDFGRVRIGLGAQRAALEFVPPRTRPIEDLEPLTAIALRRFIRAYRTVSELPIAVGLRSFTSVEFAGEAGPVLALVRAMLCQLAVMHSPDDLRISILTDEPGRAEWDWCKWLPHISHATARDEAGPVRVVSGDHDTLMDLLGASVTDRPDFDRTVPPGPNEPFHVVVAHRVHIPEHSRLLDTGLRNVVLLDVTGGMHGGPDVLRLTVAGEQVEFPAGDSTGKADADQMSVSGAENVARLLAPMRTSGTVDLIDEPLESNFDLTTLLGIRDARGFDVQQQWRPRRNQRARLVVPVGVTENGEVVELDIKESAQGGMGPHGVLIGATGSGKSEFLRTLVIGLAATHSSEVLNMVLVDFKGGATFMGMDKMPHTSAVITNLQDELPLVDRMQDSLQGEMNRRQEFLRQHGYSSLYDYEKARAGGAQLAPFPVLFVVVDEFSELLSSKPEFMDLFVQIGRLGRSLGVHLLLASQRLDEGRIHRVEGHLSYRIALRTFSAMESRSVIGVASAYELPSAPGHGFLKIDTTNLVRFKAAYVSGPCPDAPDSSPAAQSKVVGEVAPFGLMPGRIRRPEDDAPARTTEEVQLESAGDGEDSLMDVLIDRLVDQGPPARQVWLPPLAASPSLDELLPGIVPDPVRGMTALDHPATRSLRVPLGIVDRPYEQIRELLVADLSGANGHVGLVGAPQSGKSTLLRTLVLSLALTHTAEEVQFYCLDLAGGGLVSTAGLPHVGSIATRLERDRVLRTIEELAQLLERREQIFTELGIDSMIAYRQGRTTGKISDPNGDVFLIIDGWGTVRSDFQDLEPRITELAARGLAFGLHVVVATNRWSEIRPAMRDVLGTKLELRLGDPMESELGARVAARVPEQAGRGLTSAKFHFLAGLPRIDSSSATDDLTTATKAAVEEIATFWAGQAAPEVRLLPNKLPVADLPAPQPEAARFAIGLDEQRLQPVWHDFDMTPHLSVFGDTETGKTNMLRLIARNVITRYSPTEARILLADTRRQLHEEVPEPYRIGYAVDPDALSDLIGNAGVSMTRRMPGPEITPDRLPKRDWWTGPQLFVLIDDYDLFVSGGGMASPMQPLIPLLAHGASIGLHVVIARSTSGAMRAMMDPLLRRMWELGNPGVLLSYPKEEGKFLGEAKPRQLPPGRAQLVTRRDVRLLQTGMA
ncbi:MAG TPA: type VII secretion protein EccCa [Kutzneria sp.]|jgi:S-DNA-T family DNA segregation ATPase FtsK/SpoIIIE|nr:type VII secretion protein EccCa [Kutzneria sp.]